MTNSSTSKRFTVELKLNIIFNVEQRRIIARSVASFLRFQQVPYALEPLPSGLTLHVLVPMRLSGISSGIFTFAQSLNGERNIP